MKPRKPDNPQQPNDHRPRPSVPEPQTLSTYDLLLSDMAVLPYPWRAGYVDMSKIVAILPLEFAGGQHDGKEVIEIFLQGGAQGMLKVHVADSKVIEAFYSQYRRWRLARRFSVSELVAYDDEDEDEDEGDDDEPVIQPPPPAVETKP